MIFLHENPSTNLANSVKYELGKQRAKIQGEDSWRTSVQVRRWKEKFES
jgi:hypothetical protein